MITLQKNKEFKYSYTIFKKENQINYNNWFKNKIIFNK